MREKINYFFDNINHIYPGNRQINILDQVMRDYLAKNFNEGTYNYVIQKSGQYGVDIVIAWYEENKVHLVTQYMFVCIHFCVSNNKL